MPKPEKDWPTPAKEMPDGGRTGTRSEVGASNVCILRLSALGDVTHVIPVVLSLQKQRPGIRITWIIGKIEAKLIGDLPGVEFIVFDKKAGWRGYVALWRQIRHRRFDALLHMQVAMRANLVAALVHARLRVGYDQARSRDLHGLFINARIRATAQQHVRDCLASFLEPLGLEAAPPEWRIPLEEGDYNLANRIIEPGRPSVVISPCASHALRNWPWKRYAAVADYAAQRYGAQIILVGSPAPHEKEACQAIETAMTHSCVNLCGQDTLKELAALTQKADLVIAPDTGPAHIANAMGTPVLGLFAASNPNRSGPYSSLELCVNRYPQALAHFTGHQIEDTRWGRKAEFEGAMEMIEVSEVCKMLDRWAEAKGIATITGQ